MTAHPIICYRAYLAGSIAPVWGSLLLCLPCQIRSQLFHPCSVCRTPLSPTQHQPPDGPSIHIRHFRLPRLRDQVRRRGHDQRPRVLHRTIPQRKKSKVTGLYKYPLGRLVATAQPPAAYLSFLAATPAAHAHASVSPATGTSGASRHQPRRHPACRSREGHSSAAKFLLVFRPGLPWVRRFRLFSTFF